MPCPLLSSMCPAQRLGSSFFSVLSPPPAASSRAAELHSSGGAVHMIFVPGAAPPGLPGAVQRWGPAPWFVKGSPCWHFCSSALRIRVAVITGEEAGGGRRPVSVRVNKTQALWQRRGETRPKGPRWAVGQRPVGQSERGRRSSLVPSFPAWGGRHRSQEAEPQGGGGSRNTVCTGNGRDIAGFLVI